LGTNENERERAKKIAEQNSPGAKALGDVYAVAVPVFTALSALSALTAFSLAHGVVGVV
jgi:hypothetical protein